MAIEVTDLTTLSNDNIRQQQEELSQLMREAQPQIDTGRGPLHDILFRNEAVYAEKSAEELRRLQLAQSLLAASTDPELADEDIIEAVASNYRITRRPGSTSSGQVTIVVDTLAPLTIPTGSSFEANGRSYVTEVAYSAKTAADQVASDTDRVLNPVSNEHYAFTVSVVDSEIGAAGNLQKDTLMVLQDPPVAYVTSFAAEDFIAGADEENNANLIGRALLGMAAKALSGSVHMKASLTDTENFPTVVASSVIGYGDAEMLRDQHSIFPGSLGGRVDWYVRSDQMPRKIQITKTATLVEKTELGTGIFQFGVNRDEHPGFYDVAKIVRTGDTSTGYLVTSDVRSVDMSVLDNDGWLPDIATAMEGVYSRFQTAVIQFEDDGTGVSAMAVGDTQVYDVTLRGMSDIAEMQEWASSVGVRNRAGDALIKGPIPALLQVSFEIQLKPGQETPDTETIANNLATLVNTYGFTGRLPASALADIVHNSLTDVAHIGAIDMLADIRRPDGTIRRVRSTDILLVPDEPEYMTTAKTVAFILDPEDVAISVITVDIPEV